LEKRELLIREFNVICSFEFLLQYFIDKFPSQQPCQNTFQLPALATSGNPWWYCIQRCSDFGKDCRYSVFNGGAYL